MCLFYIIYTYYINYKHIYCLESRIAPSDPYIVFCKLTNYALSFYRPFIIRVQTGRTNLI